jgi:dihydroxy-acid dehydratase
VPPKSWAWAPPAPKYARGYGALFAQQVSQANLGCDFELLARAGDIPDPDIY